MRRERSVLRGRAGLAAIVAGAGVQALCGCAGAPPPPAAPTVAEATPIAPPAASASIDDIEWEGATPRDRELAAEVLALTRRAVERMLPALGPLDGVRVRVVVSDAPQPWHVAYFLGPREVRVERRFMDRLNLAHEATHALLHGRLGIAPPRWFDEAVAQLAAYDVVHGKPLEPPTGRPLFELKALRALDGEAWLAAGGHAYADSANWLGFLLPSGPAPDAEKAAFARYVEVLAASRDVVLADRELATVTGR